MEELNFNKDREVKAKLVEFKDEDMEVCGQRIREGKLVSFPTETVYGLGADATNEDAVLSIFEAKGRPLTDPVIVHIATSDMVDKILLDTDERKLIKYIGGELWPGPLTLIGPCDTSYIPDMVGSNTGTVGVRWPDHKIAQELILAAQRPIAAPSANRFMHVSPTKFSHVFYDLYDKDIHIIKGEQTNLGVESTVCRIMKNEDGELTAVILRPGTTEARTIREVLDKNPEYRDVQIELKKKKHHVEEDENACAPGQLLKHYSPLVECKLLVDKEDVTGLEKISQDKKKVAIIDFAGKYSQFKEEVGLYKDLSTKGDFKEALHGLYLNLRECEVFEGIELILVTYLEEGYNDGEFGATLFDKIFRSASGEEYFYHNGEVYC